ncbi:MAG: GNAT family N-acetyltransferase [Bacteroidales bacterium]|jgi:GNAT superfamily N-acetyltransferase|nr:GNAT family N-acetyltransferase [Bacteroidales bacterium]MCI1784926.1 GNAT family N-acetyltransferase [Bacteroidales bacterium]
MLQTTLTIKVFDNTNKPDTKERQAIIDFLFDNLEDYGDPKYQIGQAVAYALEEKGSLGGFLLVSYCIAEGVTAEPEISGAVVINKTGMADYIPDNILVYIATHKGQRGKGIGKTLLKKAIELAEGDIALHVEPRNPAKQLYERLGFTNKYLEMRYKKEV